MIAIITVAIVIAVAIAAVFFSGLRKYRKRKDPKIMFLDISEIKILFVVLYVMSAPLLPYSTGPEFYEPIEHGLSYAALSGRHLLSFEVYRILCFLSVAIICFKETRLPPLALSLCIVFIIIGIILKGLTIAQIGIGEEWIEWIFLGLTLGLNTILLIALLITVVQRERQAALNREYKNKFLNKINAIISAHYFLLAFVLLIPVFVVITLILLLFGQEYDSMVKVWTETTTWTFSQREHPPYLQHHGGHYLCTVAACGHPRIVKPLRLGLRHGKTIIVNRQLMVANAYEDMLKRHFKTIHHIIRSIYDRYGYPISKHITNRFASDVVYILMKPLEFFFLANLYLFELKPEEVIRRQYAK